MKIRVGAFHRPMPYVEYDEVEVVCTDCGRIFRTEEALSHHRVEAHETEGRARAGGEAAAPVTCAVCHGKFPSVSALARHNRRAHTG